jgi:cupin fold WbuC family metalloprotein
LIFCQLFAERRFEIVQNIELERVSGAATISHYERVLGVDAALIKRKSQDATANPRKREIHMLHSGNSDAVQRMLNALQPASYIRPHRHAQPPKSETVILLTGSVGFVTFLDDGTPRELVHLHPTQALAVDCREKVWHTFFALEPNTVVFEVKSGPHDAATDKEFAAWAPEDNSPDVERYFTHLKELFVQKL